MELRAEKFVAIENLMRAGGKEGKGSEGVAAASRNNGCTMHSATPSNTRMKILKLKRSGNECVDAVYSTDEGNG